MSLVRAREGLRYKWIVSIKSHSGPQQNGLPFHSQVFWPITFALLVGSLSSNVKLLLFLRRKEKKGRVKLHAHGYSVPSRWQCNQTYLSILVVQTYHAPIRQGLRQIQARRKKNKAQWNARRTLPKCSTLQNKVGWGHCLVRYNYTFKLSLSLWHNGR